MVLSVWQRIWFCLFDKWVGASISIHMSYINIIFSVNNNGFAAFQQLFRFHIFDVLIFNKHMWGAMGDRLFKSVYLKGDKLATKHCA